MNWTEALEIVVARTRHDAYRALCDEDNPDVTSRDAYRSLMISMASEEPVNQSYPSWWTQITSAAGAVVEFAASGFKVATEAEQADRLAICQACEHYDAEADRCRKCGCFSAVKAWVAVQHCPIGKW
jgi:hypothetical protein